MTQSIAITSIKCTWRTSPPFLNQYVIEIMLPFTCPYSHNHIKDECEIYKLSSNSEIVERLQNPIGTKQMLKAILDHYITDPDRPHINQIAFRGDFMIKENFDFMNEFLEYLMEARLGIFICAETYGSEDENELPKLLKQGIIDELMIKMVVYPTIEKEHLHHAEIALNSLSQGISALNVFIEDNEGETMRCIQKVSISFLFTKESNINVFIAYLAALYNAFKLDENNFTAFEIYLRGDGTEPNGIIEQAYLKAIEGFEPDRIYNVCIQNKESDCIFFNS